MRLCACCWVVLVPCVCCSAVGGGCPTALGPPGSLGTPLCARACTQRHCNGRLRHRVCVCVWRGLLPRWTASARGCLHRYPPQAAYPFPAPPAGYMYVPAPAPTDPAPGAAAASGCVTHCADSFAHPFHASPDAVGALRCTWHVYTHLVAHAWLRKPEATLTFASHLHPHTPHWRVSPSPGAALACPPIHVHVHPPPLTLHLQEVCTCGPLQHRQCGAGWSAVPRGPCRPLPTAGSHQRVWGRQYVCWRWQVRAQCDLTSPRTFWAEVLRGFARRPQRRPADCATC